MSNAEMFTVYVVVLVVSLIILVLLNRYTGVKGEAMEVLLWSAVMWPVAYCLILVLGGLAMLMWVMDTFIKLIARGIRVKL